MRACEMHCTILLESIHVVVGVLNTGKSYQGVIVCSIAFLSSNQYGHSIIAFNFAFSPSLTFGPSSQNVCRS